MDADCANQSRKSMLGYAVSRCVVATKVLSVDQYTPANWDYRNRKDFDFGVTSPNRLRVRQMDDHCRSGSAWLVLIQASLTSPCTGFGVGSSEIANCRAKSATSEQKATGKIVGEGAATQRDGSTDDLYARTASSSSSSRPGDPICPRNLSLCACPDTQPLSRDSLESNSKKVRTKEFSCRLAAPRLMKIQSPLG
jgi:hypothetical protein